MAIYDNFPWTNVHELNLGWIIEQVKAGNIKIDGFEEALEQFEEDYDTLSALAAAFTIAGSNISTTKNFSAASLSGPLTGNVTGNLTGNVTGNVTGDVTGDLTGNVTGNVTGDVTGNADTATTADYATSAALATEAETITWRDDITGADMDSYIDTVVPLSLFKATGLTTHIPSAITSGRSALILSFTAPSNAVMQFAWFYAESLDVYQRCKYGGTWQSWRKITMA